MAGTSSTSGPPFFPSASSNNSSNSCRNNLSEQTAWFQSVKPDVLQTVAYGFDPSVVQQPQHIPHWKFVSGWAALDASGPVTVSTAGPSKGLSGGAGAAKSSGTTGTQELSTTANLKRDQSQIQQTQTAAAQEGGPSSGSDTKMLKTSGPVGTSLGRQAVGHQQQFNNVGFGGQQEQPVGFGQQPSSSSSSSFIARTTAPQAAMAGQQNLSMSSLQQRQQKMPSTGQQQPPVPAQPQVGATTASGFPSFGAPQPRQGSTLQQPQNRNIKQPRREAQHQSFNNHMNMPFNNTATTVSDPPVVSSSSSSSFRPPNTNMINAGFTTSNAGTLSGGPIAGGGFGFGQPSSSSSFPNSNFPPVASVTRLPNETTTNVKPEASLTAASQSLLARMRAQRAKVKDDIIVLDDD